MAKLLRCKDTGTECDYEVKAETTEELIELCKKHATEFHGMNEVPESMLEKVREAIREV